MKVIFSDKYIGMLSLLLVVFASGCCVTTSIKLENEMSETITVSEGGNEKVVLESGTMKVIPHTYGVLEISSKNGEQQSYGEINLPSIARDKMFGRHTSGILGCHNKLQICCRIMPDGKLYLIPWKRKDKEKFEELQPEGFPLPPSGCPKK